MSTHNVDLLRNVAGTKHPLVHKADFVKAWLRADGAAATNLASFGVSSTTDAATGLLGTGMTNAMASASAYVVAASLVDGGWKVTVTQSYGASSFNTASGTMASAAADPSVYCLTVSGTLA
jgi:hypothetical protein